jgi:hypothetical protein
MTGTAVADAAKRGHPSNRLHVAMSGATAFGMPDTQTGMPLDASGHGRR